VNAVLRFEIVGGKAISLTVEQGGVKLVGERAP
jgi:hypothetical protein